jgi:opacity protein-like surface antigen
MTKIKMILLAGAVALVSLNLTAADVSFGPNPPPQPGEVWTKEQAKAVRDAGVVYQARELDSPFAPGFWVGIFASAQVDEIVSFEQIKDDHEAGGGIEFGYSFTPRLSVALELQGQASTIKSSYLNEGGITVSYGIPLFGIFKPYVLGGVGYFIVDNRELDVNTWAGAGAEVALTKTIRAFGDYRYYVTGYEGRQMIRGGLRKTF